MASKHACGWEFLRPDEEIGLEGTLIHFKYLESQDYICLSKPPKST